MKGGEKVNKKIAAIFVGLLSVAILATPVLAIGPENSVDKNPNVQVSGPGISLLNPSHIDVDWVLYAGPVPRHVIWKNALYFKINNAFVITDVHQALVMDNIWLYLSQQLLYDLLILRGAPPALATIIASNNPEGIYMKSVPIGQ
jgi:hypothetical protein